MQINIPFVLQITIGSLCFMINFFHLQVHDIFEYFSSFLYLNFSEWCMYSCPGYVVKDQGLTEPQAKYRMRNMLR